MIEKIDSWTWEDKNNVVARSQGQGRKFDAIGINIKIRQHNQKKKEKDNEDTRIRTSIKVNNITVFKIEMQMQWIHENIPKRLMVPNQFYFNCLYLNLKGYGNGKMGLIES